jgi:hypothetical protein
MMCVQAIQSHLDPAHREASALTHEQPIHSSQWKTPHHHIFCLAWLGSAWLRIEFGLKKASNHRFYPPYWPASLISKASKEKFCMLQNQ